MPPSKPTAQQEQLSQTLHRTMQYLDYRQMQLAMLQFAGVIAKPCFEGWNFFKMRFEQVMVKHYGGLVTSDFERRMNDDANMLMWCYMNFYAVFMARPGARARAVGRGATPRGGPPFRRRCSRTPAARSSRRRSSAGTCSASAKSTSCPATRCASW